MKNKVSSIGKNTEQLEISYIAGESEVAENILENYFVVSTKAKQVPTLWPSNPALWGMCNGNANTYLSKHAQERHSNLIHNS